jgi:outer membrane biosynthesis protein TonB
VAELGVSQPTVSKHLKILREAGMVSMEARGQRRLYAVEPEPLAAVTDWVQEVVGAAAHAPATPEPTTAPGPTTPATTPVTAPVPEPRTPATEPAAEPHPVPVTPAAATGAAPVPAPRQAAGAEPEQPAGATPGRPARGAGARAADLFSTLSGLRRRGRQQRRR